MSPMQTKKEEVKMLCKEQDDGRIEGRQNFLVQGGEMSRFYSARATNVLIKFALCFSVFSHQNSGREGLV